MLDPTEPIIAPPPAVPSGLLVDGARAAVLRQASRDWPSWDLTPRQLADLELLLSGFYEPLVGFMGRDDYEAVLTTMRLASGQLWPLPIGLAITPALAASMKPGATLALRDPEGVMLAALHVAEIWESDAGAPDARLTAGESNPAESQPSWHVGGRVEGVQLPVHHDFGALRLTAAGVRAELARRGWSRAIGIAPKSLLHRAEIEGLRHLIQQHDAGVVVHVTDGPRGDVHRYARLRCYRLALARLPPGRALLVLSPSIALERDARVDLALAMMQRRFGCSHVALAPGDVEGADADTQSRLGARAPELGVEFVSFPRLSYSRRADRYVLATDQQVEDRLSLADLHRCLEAGTEIPPWFTYPEIGEQLRRSHPPRREQGLTIFFTGLSGSGKSTIANALLDVLLERGGRSVTLLDGDLARRHLSSELGFSKAHRTLNVRRIGYVASEITRSGGIAICALIAPHAAVRQEVRHMIEAVGGFVLVHVATTLAVCEARDRKGLYAKARAGLLAEFTGISDPYEVPEDAELTIDAAALSVSEAARAVLGYLETAGYLAPQPGTSD